MLKPFAIALSLGLTGTTFLSGIPISSTQVSSETALYSTKEPTKEDMQNVLLAVKKKIPIPSELSEFDYKFSSANFNSSAQWIFRWYNPSSDDSIMLSCDESANIIQYEYQIRDNRTYVPNYLYPELQNTADKFIKTTTPLLDGHIKKIGNNSNTSYYSGLYYYTYQRVENKIPMPDNSITVGINYETGKVMSFRVNWDYNLTIPSADTVFTAQQAAAKMGTKMNMQLSYRNEYNADGSIRAFLVYSPTQDYISVNAKTGEVYLEKQVWNFNSSKEENQTESAADKADTGSGGLSEEEIAKLAELNNLISREEAVKKVTSQKELLLDKNLKEVNASLSKGINENGKETYYWKISLSDPRPQDGKADTYRAYAQADIDAKTGKLLSFRANTPSYYDMSKEQWSKIEIAYSKDQCNTILESFLKKQIPDQFNKTKQAYADQSYNIVKYEGENPIYGGYDYFYQRMNEEIAYPYNGIYGSVDGVTGKIYHYSVNWNDKVRFESPKAAMTPEKALDALFSKDGYGLYYEIIDIHNVSEIKDTIYDAEDRYSLKREVRLVYIPAVYPDTLSPFNGIQLDYNGKPYTPEEQYSYNDITSSPYIRDIKMLADLGIGFSGNSFYPEKAITVTEFKYLLNTVSSYGELDNFADSSSNITLMMALKQMITVLNLEKVAVLQGIYTTTFKNDAELSIADKGYIALSQGLGILESGKDIVFTPDKIVTRGEAAHYIILLLKAKKSILF